MWEVRGQRVVAHLEGHTETVVSVHEHHSYAVKAAVLKCSLGLKE